ARVGHLAVLQPAELGLVDARARRDLVEAQARRFSRPAERAEEFREGFDFPIGGGRGRDRPGLAVLVIQGLAVLPFRLAVLGRLDAIERGLRPRSLLERKRGQDPPRSLRESLRFHRDQPPYSGTE